MPGYVAPPPGLTTPDFSSGGLSTQGTTCIPTIPTCCWEGYPHESHSGQAGSGAMGSGATGSSITGSGAAGLLRWCYPCASHSHLPGVSQQPHTSRQCSCQVSLQDWESPSTPLPTNLLPLAVRTPMATGGRVLEVEMAIAPVANDTPSGSARLNPLIPLQLKAKPMPWRWMTRMVAHPQLAPSPLGRMIY